MKTCETSPPSDLFEISATCPASSSGARPARTSAAPTTARPRASMETEAACISKPSGSSAKSDLIGMRLRTLLSSRLEATTGFTLRWGRSATPAGHPWWVLSTPDFSTFASDLGLLALMCPTPRKNRWGAPDSHGRAHPMLPTPTLTGNWNRKGLSEKSGDGLATVIHGLQLTPTPTKADAKGSLGQMRGDGRPKRHLSSQLTSEHSKRPAGGLGSEVVLSLVCITEWLMGFEPGWLLRAWPLALICAAPSSDGPIAPGR